MEVWVRLSYAGRDSDIADAIFFACQILMEDFQLLPSGAVRKRGLPLSEKLLQGESWQEGIERAITEELGSILEPCTPIFSVKLTDYRQVNLTHNPSASDKSPESLL